MSNPDPFDPDQEETLRGRLRETIRDRNKQDTMSGAGVDEVIEATVDSSGYTEADARAELKEMLLDGEVYPPTEGRVKVTPS